MHTELGECYSEFFKNNSKAIYMAIIRFMRMHNIPVVKSEIDDIYQNVALKIMKNKYIEKFDGTKSSISTWIGIISRTVAIDYFRTNRNAAIEEELDDAELAAENDVESSLFTLPRGVLTRRQEEVVTLFFREGCEAEDIANRLNISRETVRSTKFQAIGKLRRHYGAAKETDAQTKEVS